MEELSQYAIENRCPKICFQELHHENELKPNLYKMLLLRYGLLIIDVKIENNDGTILQNVVDLIGEAHIHDSSGRAMWDIKQGGETGNENLARSHKSDEFVFHTDCSYEENNPSFIGLYVVKPDSKGGGKNLLISNSSIVQKLSKNGFATLIKNKYTFKVPLEFYKGID